MKKSSFGLFGAFLLGMLCLNTAQAETRESEAKASVESFISDHLEMLSIPKSADQKIFYTLCDSFGVQIALSYEGGKCTALSIDSTGKIEYAPMNIRVIKVGAGLSAIGAHLSSLHRIRGNVHSFADITGAYFFGNSGFTAVLTAAQENWFSIKFATSLIGDVPEADGNTGTLFHAGLAEVNLLSVGVFWYTVHDYSKTQSLQLSLNQVNYVLAH